MLKVTAAVIRDGNKVLLCQRPANKRHGLLWEFPGGKVEPGETEEDCISRECMEELNIVLGDLKKLSVVEADEISISYFETSIKSGDLKRKEHADLKWVDWNKVSEYQLCPNDKEMIKTLHG